MTAPVNLWLARHGETDWNLEQRFQGQTDIGLNPRGHAQAERLAQRFREIPFSAVYSSDLSRAMATALPAALGQHIDVIADRKLRERHFGKFEGHTYSEIEHRFPEDFLRWQARDPQFSLDGGESLHEVSLRICEVLQSIVSMHAGQNVLIVTHGGALDLAYRFFADLPLRAPRAWATPNAATSRIVVQQGRWHVAHWADESHLID